MVWKRLFGRKTAAEPKEALHDELTQEQEERQNIFADDNGSAAEEGHERESQTQKDPTAKSTGLFQRLQAGLSKTRKNFVDKFEALFSGRTVDEELMEELEDLLIQADVGVNTTLKLMERLRAAVKEEKITAADALQSVLQREVSQLLSSHDAALRLGEKKPAVIMVVGVNGAGKTTTIGKLAHRLQAEGASVLLGAGDTFRAAAIDQLQIWGERVQVDVIAHTEGSDPAAVAFDAVAAAKARGTDVLILDTAGRLQTKTNLMRELGKVHRVLQRELDHAIDEVLLVLDATTGQNAMSQAKLFSESVPVTGIALTKLDGTAKGGIVLAIADELNLPVKLIGVGEQYDDLQDFDAAEFSQALFGSEN